MKQKDELKDSIVSFIKSICEDFPGIGKRMKGAIENIEADLSRNFSVMTVLKVASDIAEVMSSEVDLQKMTMQELAFLLDVTNEHIINEKESGSHDDLVQAEKLKKALKFEVRSTKLTKKMDNIARELRKIISNDRSILDADKAAGIYSSFIRLAEGKKPEEIPEFEENLRHCRAIVKIYALKDRAMKLEEERQLIMEKTIASDFMRDKKRMLLEKEILSAKIRLLEKSARNYREIEDKKKAAILLRKIKNFMRLVETERDWNALSYELHEYFNSKKEFATDPFDLNNPKSNSINIIPGIFQAG